MQKQYFTYCPENGIEFFDDIEKRDARAKELTENWLDDGWAEEVEQVIAGEVTHIATKTDVVKKPDDSEIDEDGNDEDGNYWGGDFTEVCNYKMMPLPKPPSDV
jgi:hypothetical protein